MISHTREPKTTEDFKIGRQRRSSNENLSQKNENKLSGEETELYESNFHESTFTPNAYPI